MHIIPVTTRQRQQIVDLTKDIRDYLRDKNLKTGVLLVYSPHTTAGITVNENADPSVKKDISNYLAGLVPSSGNYTHAEGNSDAHIKGTLTGFSQTFIVEDGELKLGTWQGIFFMEFDGPRQREIWLKFVPAQD